MDRRSFLKTTGTLAAAATISKTSLAAAPIAAGRAVYPINRNWRYTPKTSADVHSPTFNDAHMERVIVPHTNKAVPWHNFDDSVYEFVSAYRRPIAVPASAHHNKRVFVDFEGVMLASTVYCNGHKLGEYKGGYTPFSFEITDHLKPSGNVISLDVDSTER
ncbi:MAG: sugar-binding domain-containing protein, partial [Bryocella sp.]